MKSWLPDVNVWVALNDDRHSHHPTANEWYHAVPDNSCIVFCRQTQLGLFRVLSAPAVMGDEALTLRACWQIFDRWMGTGQVRWATEAAELDQALRTRTTASSISPKTWTDAYLAAFAESAGLSLVTFDRALASKTKGALLLS